MSLAKLVEGKSVAITGRAEYLNQMTQGEFIDSHEVVIRVQSNLPYPSPKYDIKFDNDKSFVPADFHSILGAKTTAFAPANMPYWGLSYSDTLIPELIKRGCKCLIQHKVYNMVGAAEVAAIDYIQDKYNIPVFVARYEHLVEIIRALDYTFPMPGTLLIDWVVRSRPKAVYCTGFACYQDTKDEWLKAEVKLARDHKALYDLRFLRDLVLRNANVTVDQELMNYFNHI